ncbi:glycogen operon protein GlgX homolog [Roseobacter cerasinus]|uniref:Glycogen operon protein GlgX homolog n=1 Tax=Roseobacter cerasinus TaxID=2602289 RepID=A0A640VP52_9RHOB|nr:glycogen debranching protein GlgX [Roseobacter cerasinus]GFE49809.1 glycogen operon protein GlgX homolog [Roseobacter cerasinus]
MAYAITSGTPFRMGAHHDGEGVNFAVFSANASRMELCLFSADGNRETARLSLPERTGDIWHGYVAGLPAGTLYGYRAHGAYAPERGHRFNPHKLLLDPYTRELRGAWRNTPALLGYDQTSSAGDLSFDGRDSAPFVPKSVVSDPAAFPLFDRRAPKPWDETLIYEAHVKGLTQLHPGVAEGVRGTYDGLASDAVLEHLHKIGVTAVELLPVHAFLNDGFLLDKGLTNYWGYNTIGFFAPEPRYLGPAGIAGFRQMVQRFHDAGIEVLLDVVYNHTAEGDQRGPTLSFRGLDNASYYRLISGQPRYYVNDTGTGNTVNVSHPHVLRMVMDSLRFWVECMGVDGFRFDLATAVAREDHGFDPHGGFLDAIRQDPVLAGVKLIAEPWDIGPGGYRLGQFPPKFAEWNDAYRDSVRRFWRGDAHSAQELGARLLGSAGEFDRGGRRAWSSLNFIAAHDGFTLADITRYSTRHNAANGEDNQDGHHANYSDNCGVEGPSDDPEITARRRQRQRNMLATLFLSQGTPMLLAGDELGHSQQGNNNAYCQDNELTWLDWATGDAEMVEFVAHLADLRRQHPVLRQSRFLHAALRPSDGLPDVAWSDFEGHPLNWRDPGLSSFCVTLRGSAEMAPHLQSDDVIFAIFNRSEDTAEATLPPARDGQGWVVVLDSARGVTEPLAVPEGRLTVSGPSVTALVLRDKAASA